MAIQDNRRHYPALEDVDVVLRDGSTVRLRPILDADREAMRAFLGGLSEHSRTFRFFGQIKDVSRAVDEAVRVDYRESHSIVAIHGDEIVGHGFYTQTRPAHAEMALAVADAYQGRGLGTILLQHLAAHASAVDVVEFTAFIMSGNGRMLEMLRESGFPVESRASAGVVTAVFPTSLTAGSRERFQRRAQTAAVAALSRFFTPRSIAVVGASGRRGSVGGELFHNLLESGLEGPVYPVSPHPVVHSVPAYPTVDAIPGPVDLAVIAVPAAQVAGVARACAAKGVTSLVVVSAGFAEIGPEGAARQAELVEICRGAGMRLIGPNCLGILSTAGPEPFNATFGPHRPPAGRVGFMSQSGALGLAVIEYARQTGLGLSQFVSVGDKADISGNDLLDFWEDDPSTDVAVLYLESFGNPRRFAHVARRVAQKKPILAVKGGRTAAGARAASSHTGALLAASDLTVDALFQQSGVIRADTLGELFDVAGLLSIQPPPKGWRVGIVTNAGGLGILCADACASAGLELPVLGESTRERLHSFLPGTASTANPVDMIASAGAADYEQAIETLGRSGDVDAVIVIFISPLATDTGAITRSIARSAGALGGEIPVLAVMTDGDDVAAPPGLPRFRFPEDAARALAKVAGWSEWRRRAAEPPWSATDVRVERAKALVATTLARDDGWLTADEADELLACFGIPTAPSQPAATARGVGRAAVTIGGRVVVKAQGPALLHKSDVGAVALGVQGPAAARAAEAMRARLEAAGHEVTGFLVQSQIEGGVELLVGLTSDPAFGPVLVVGAGGTATEVVRDVRVALPPLSEAEADRMLQSLRIAPLLNGYRGQPPADLRSLRDLVLRVGVIADTMPEVAELDLNPVLAGPSGAIAVDARVRVVAREPEAPEEARPRGRSRGV